MNDLISRQDAIEAICEACYDENPQKCEGRKEGSNWCEYMVAMRKVPSAHPLDPCETCLHKGKGWDEDPCDGCTGTESKYEPDNGWIPVQKM